MNTPLYFYAVLLPWLFTVILPNSSIAAAHGGFSRPWFVVRTRDNRVVYDSIPSSSAAASTPIGRIRAGSLAPPPGTIGGGVTTIDNTVKSTSSLSTSSPPSAGASTTTGTDDDDDDADETVEIAKKLRNRNHSNLSRKFTHAGFGIFFACLNQFIPHVEFVRGMKILTSLTLLMELLRYRRGFRWMNTILHFFLGKALRKHEMEGKFTGSFYYFAGVTMNAMLYPRTAGTLGIIQLALADPSASYFGRRTRHIYWSRINNGLGGLGRNKGILGFIGGALFCFPFNYRVLKIAKWGIIGIPGGKPSLVLASLLLGMAGSFADLAVPTPALVMPKKVLGIPVPPFHVDDNFVVPIFSGWACTRIFKILAWDDGLELAKHIIF